MTTVLVADDHPVVREGIAAILSSVPGIDIVGQAGTGREVLAAADRLRPDIVMIDLRLPDQSGIEVCAALRERESRSRTVIVTSFPNEGALMSAFENGAKGFVIKGSEPSALRDAVRIVAGGGTYVDPRTASRLVTLATKRRRLRGPFDLTGQELRVIELLPRGLTNRAIGRELGVHEETIKTHVKHILQKLRARDRAQAAAIALREGLA